MESYLKLTLPGDTQLTMGKLIYTWGKGEFYSPTDNMSPYDYLDVIDRLKEPVYSGELSNTFDTSTGPVDLSVIFIPFFTPARDPLAQSRWTPATTFIPGVGDSVPGDVFAQQIRGTEDRTSALTEADLPTDGQGVAVGSAYAPGPMSS